MYNTRRDDCAGVCVCVCVICVEIITINASDKNVQTVRTVEIGSLNFGIRKNNAYTQSSAARLNSGLF